MTTNIKLFENWLAEEGAAVETPPAVDATAAATTLTTTVKPAAVAAKVTPTKFTATGRIGQGVDAGVLITAPATPFDITKSILTINIGNTSVTYNYDIKQTPPCFIINPATTFKYKDTLAAAKACAGSNHAQKSLTAIVYDALGQTKSPVSDGGWNTILASKSGTNSLSAIIQAAGTTSYGASVPSPNVEYGPFRSMVISCEVNLDTRKPTGNYTYRYEYKERQSGIIKSGRGKVYATTNKEPFVQMYDSMRNGLELDGNTPGGKATIKQISELANNLIKSAQDIASRPAGA